jgi:hypothetical protein
MMSWNDSWHRKISTGRHFQNGHHNSAQIQRFAVLWRSFWKWWPVEIFQCRESIRDIIIYPHIKFWWYWTMLNFYPHFLYDIEKFLPVTIFKMAATIPHKFNIVRYHQNLICGFLMSGIISGHHNLPTYEMALKSDNVEFVRYCGGHFENGDQ